MFFLRTVSNIFSHDRPTRLIQASCFLRGRLIHGIIVDKIELYGYLWNLLSLPLLHLVEFVHLILSDLVQVRVWIEVMGPLVERYLAASCSSFFSLASFILPYDLEVLILRGSHEASRNFFNEQVFLLGFGNNLFI